VQQNGAACPVVRIRFDCSVRNFFIFIFSFRTFCLSF
jgi:hypothetical protein